MHILFSFGFQPAQRKKKKKLQHSRRETSQQRQRDNLSPLSSVWCLLVRHNIPKLTQTNPAGMKAPDRANLLPITTTKAALTPSLTPAPIVNFMTTTRERER